MKNITVFFGGRSIEHEISIITGLLTTNSVDKKYNVLPIFVDKKGEFFTGESLKNPDFYKNLDYKKIKKVALIPGSNCIYYLKGKKIKKGEPISCAINCMHGERGEDGSLSSLLSLCGIACASPDALSSSACMSKSFTKIVLKGLGVPCLPFSVAEDVVSSLSAEKLNYPLIVKPNTGGSSIGISKVNNRRELETAVIDALSFSKKAIIEPALENFIEINCASFKDGDGNIIVSECERPIGKEEVLSFSDKYECGKREFPAKIEKDLEERIKKTTSRIYKEMNFKGVIRIDFFIHNEKIYVNEINTVPGSLAYYLFCKSTDKFREMLNELIDYAESVFNKESLLKTTFDSGIISNLVSKGSKTVK
ncbi:MAG: ATP-grasp domain-containing protein [Clostridia bacterium]|nr:ATP-grasp domain-containing protein [Clostridia bacterium]